MKWITLLVIAFSFSQIQAADSKHNLGGLYGTGVANAEIDNEDDDWAAQQGIFYEYHIDPNLMIHTAIIEGAGDFCFIVCHIGEYRKASWRTWQLDVKGSFPMTKRWHIFGRFGSNYYEAKISGNRPSAQPKLPTISESGWSYMAAFGLEFRADKGFKFGFEVQHFPMKLLKVNTHGVFAGFSF